MNHKESQFTAWQQLKHMKGREDIQENIRMLVMRSHIAKRDLSEMNLHIALLGNPGTGKTVLAKIIADIYRQEGLLESGHIVTVTRKDLVGGYVGQTAILTAKAIDRAMGGVLFIDEAYQLSEKTSENDFGQEAIDTVLEAMSERMGQFAVIIGGYPKQTRDFIAGAHANPSLARRFPEPNRWELADYSPEILHAIFLQKIEGVEMQLAPELEDCLPQAFERWYEQRDPEKFGNAGDVETLVQTLMSSAVSCGRRVLTKDDFISADWQDYFDGGKRVPDINMLLADLDKMVGLNGAKNYMRNFLANQSSISSVKNGPGYFVFSGNPGTGKTTVARLMGHIFKELGLLRNGHVLEVRRCDLVGQYVGHTEDQVKEILNKALDGVLLIDEAYQLTEQEDGEVDFGKNAIDVLLAFMENNRDRLCVIVAGYPELMQHFLASNPGLRSRFSDTIVFDDFNADDLEQIAHDELAQNRFTLTSAGKSKLNQILTNWCTHRAEDFGNARDVCKLIDRIKMNQARRLANIVPQPTEDQLFIIEAEDIPSI